MFFKKDKKDEVLKLTQQVDIVLAELSMQKKINEDIMISLQQLMNLNVTLVDKIKLHEQVLVELEQLYMLYTPNTFDNDSIQLDPYELQQPVKPKQKLN